eukprot:1434339-Amphidinium_carterae.1
MCIRDRGRPQPRGYAGGFTLRVSCGICLGGCWGAMLDPRLATASLPSFTFPPLVKNTTMPSTLCPHQ